MYMHSTLNIHVWLRMYPIVHTCICNFLPWITMHILVIFGPNICILFNTIRPILALFQNTCSSILPNHKVVEKVPIWHQQRRTIRIAMREQTYMYESLYKTTLQMMCTWVHYSISFTYTHIWLYIHAALQICHKRYKWMVCNSLMCIDCTVDSVPTVVHWGPQLHVLYR